MIVRQLDDIATGLDAKFKPLVTNITNVDPYKCGFIDIETTSGKKTFEDCDQWEQSLFEKKIQNMLSQMEMDASGTTSDLYTQKAALFPEYGKITCISFGYLKPNQTIPTIFSFIHDDEKQLIENFFKFFVVKFNHIEFKLVGGNIRYFDLPFIHRRAMAHGLAIPKFLYNPHAKPWEMNIFDVIEFHRAGSKIGDSTMDSLCRMFGVESPKSQMDGSMTSKAYWDGKIESIATYCEADVMALFGVFMGMTKLVSFKYE